MPGLAHAGAWPRAPGETLAILKYERSVADAAFDPDGERVDLDRRVDDAVSLYVERGLTRRLTFQGRAGWAGGREGPVDYAGQGPLELGLRYALRRTDQTAISLYAGASLAGEGRNAGYAPAGAGEADLEFRVLAGRSGDLAGRPAFVEIQLARLDRAGLPDEDRLDLTAGLEPTPQWLVLAQVYAGQAMQAGDHPRWVKLELSAARRIGDWRLQAGWRQSLTGRSTPVEGGPVFAVWRSF